MKKILGNTSFDLDPGAEMKTAIYTILRSARFQVVALHDCIARQERRTCKYKEVANVCKAGTKWWMTLSKILGEKAAKYGVKCCTISLRLDVWARNVTGVLPCFSERNTAHVRWSAEGRSAQVIVAILGNLLCQMLTLLSLFAYGLVFGIEPMHNTRWVSWTYKSYGDFECLGLQLCYHWLVWLPCYLWISGCPPYFAISEYPVIGACCPLVLRASLALPAPFHTYIFSTVNFALTSNIHWKTV